VSEQRVTWTGSGFAFEGLDQLGRVVHIDTDPEGMGAKPADLLPISLAACTAWDVVNILRKQRQGLQGLDVRIETDQEEDPPWAFTRILMHFTITGDVDERKAERAVDLSEQKYCAVAASLRSSVEIGVTVQVVPADHES
jgi:putative redox protein